MSGRASLRMIARIALMSCAGFALGGLVGFYGCHLLIVNVPAVRPLDTLFWVPAAAILGACAGAFLAWRSTQNDRGDARQEARELRRLRRAQGAP